MPRATTQAVEVPRSVGAGVALFALGVVLTMTVVLSPLGLILAFMGVVRLRRRLTGPCPYCGKPVKCDSKVKGVLCKACWHRFAVDGHDFVAV